MMRRATVEPKPPQQKSLSYCQHEVKNNKKIRIANDILEAGPKLWRLETSSPIAQLVRALH